MASLYSGFVSLHCCSGTRLPVVTYSPSHRQPSTMVINVQSTLCITPNLYENVTLAVLFGSNSNSYTISTQSDMCIYAHILHNIDMVL